MVSRPTGRDDDEFLLTILAVLALVSAAGSIGLVWQKAVTWLVDAHALVPAAVRPVLALPGGHGAGLDEPRLAVAAGLALIVVAWLGSWARRAVAGRRESA